jgi:hypothetical protein
MLEGGEEEGGERLEELYITQGREMCTISCLRQELGPESACTSRTSRSIASVISAAAASLATRKRYCAVCVSFPGEVI